MTKRAPKTDAAFEQTLSVIIPARNAARTLPALLDCILELSTPPGWKKEIVASYTESNDDTLNVLESRAIKIVRSETPGPSAARNAGVRIATGSIYYFIDADARPVGDDFLVRLIHSVEELGSQESFAGFGGPILLDPSQSHNPIAQADHFACWFNWSELRRNQRTTLFQPSVSLVMTRQVFESLGGFDERIRVLEDFDLHQRALSAGYSFYFVQDFAVTHRARGTLLKSWRHSWYWGAPYRSAYFEKVRDTKLKIPLDSKWFWLNLPAVFFRRMRLVLRSARRISVWRTLISLPFIAWTVFSWSLAAVLGGGQPSPEKPHAA